MNLHLNMTAAGLIDVPVHRSSTVVFAVGIFQIYCPRKEVNWQKRMERRKHGPLKLRKA